MEYRRTYARIDLDAVGKNVESVRQRIPDKTKIMAVIKANAYGHGAVAFANYLDTRADMYGVAALYEAAELRKAGAAKDILVLGCLDRREYERAAELDVTVAVTSLEDATELSRVGEKLCKTVKVHIKVDTGMGRIGFLPTAENAKKVAKIAALDALSLEGMFTHFAVADAADKTSALTQRERFDSFVAMCEAEGVTIPLLHVNNSAGTMELDRHYGMVRMGIMLYGLYPSDEMDRSFVLYPAMELKSHVTFVKTVPEGVGISYGHTFVTDREMKIATVACGYADGYPRCLSGRGYVIIGGVRCPILGRICMDQMMVDVSHIKDCDVKPGDEVTLVGRDGDEFISVEDVADNAYSFNYEFVCGISRRVPRVYFEGGKETDECNYLV